MTKQEFLDTLRRTLSGRIPSGEINDHIHYYQNYIDGQIRQGKTEQEVMEQLGDPHILAKTIVQMSMQKGSTHHYGQQSAESYGEHHEQRRSTSDDWEKGSEIKHTLGNIRIPLWIVGVIILVIFALLFIFVGYLFVMASPFLLLGFLVWLLVRTIQGGRR